MNWYIYTAGNDVTDLNNLNNPQ